MQVVAVADKKGLDLFLRPHRILKKRIRENRDSSGNQGDP
jgi:hypothetical protein